MKRFSFSLQSVQDHRALKRESAERALGDAQSALSTEREALEKKVVARESAVGSYLKLLEGGAVNPQELALSVSHIAGLVQHEKKAKTRIAKLERTLETKREEVIAAARDEKAITTLRDRHHARHKSAADRVEQMVMDEIASLAFVRRVS